MDRRSFLEGVAASAPLLGGACKDKPSEEPAPAPNARKLPSWLPSFFSLEQALALEAAVERLLPETETPGAKGAAIAPFMESVVSDVYEPDAQRAFLAGLDQLNERATKAHGAGFAECAEPAQTALLGELQKEALALRKPWEPGKPNPAPPFVDSLRSLAVIAFCNSRLGATRVLAYEPSPGPFVGCVSVESVGRPWFDG